MRLEHLSDELVNVISAGVSDAALVSAMLSALKDDPERMTLARPAPLGHLLDVYVSRFENSLRHGYEVIGLQELKASLEANKSSQDQATVLFARDQDSTYVIILDKDQHRVIAYAAQTQREGAQGSGEHTLG